MYTMLSTGSDGANRRRRLNSGQILAEAAIGLSVMALAWVMLAYMTYMANNRIHTAMAVRDAVWLQSNGEATDTVAAAFFTTGDATLVTIPAATSTSLPLPGGVPAGPWSATATTNTVSFGLAADKLSTTTQFPFVLLNTTLPFLGAPTVTAVGAGTAPLSWSLLTVSTAGAWPANTSDAFSSDSDAYGGIFSGFQLP